MKTRSKSDETRARILAAALELFRRQGFGQTTMREVANEAGVATGAAYYYFDSKEAIVMAFYQQAQDEVHERIVSTLSRKKGVRARLRAILELRLDYFAANRKFLGALLRHAADPADALSPFSRETESIREGDIAHFAAALEGVNPPADLAPHLPRLLWLYQMGIILFWLHDPSPSQKRTWDLIDKSLTLVVQLIRLAGFPLLRPLRKRVVDLLESVMGAPPLVAGRTQP
ncbi:MAG: TetR/AcrR family transcriptional regulator [Bryobacteraceae bacterium]